METVRNYDVKITLPIDDNYASVSFDLKLDDVASAFDIPRNEISAVTYFAIDSNGNEDSISTSSGNGHWFDKDGYPENYGANSYLYSELNLATGTAAVGHYPNRVSDGETYAFRQGLRYGSKRVLYNVLVTITNEKGNASSETTTALMYGLNGPSKNIDLSYVHGVLNIDYTLKRRDNVKVSIFSPYGALLHTEISGMQNAGTHRYSFDFKKSGLPNATYIVKISTGDYREAKSITISR